MALLLHRGVLGQRAALARLTPLPMRSAVPVAMLASARTLVHPRMSIISRSNAALPLVRFESSKAANAAQSAQQPAASAGSAATASAEPAAVPFSFSNLPAWWRSMHGRLRHMMKNYGYFAVASYLGVYVVTLAGLFGAVKLGLVSGPDVNAYINDWRLKKLITDKHVVLPEWSIEFGTAWVLTKTTEPLRLVATLALLPRLLRRASPSTLRLFRVPAHEIQRLHPTAAKSGSFAAGVSAAPSGGAAAMPSTGGSSQATSSTTNGTKDCNTSGEVCRHSKVW